jgi:hypothetical protein
MVLESSSGRHAADYSKADPAVLERELVVFVSLAPIGSYCSFCIAYLHAQQDDDGQMRAEFNSLEGFSLIQRNVNDRSTKNMS